VKTLVKNSMTTEELVELAIRSIDRLPADEKLKLREAILSRGNQRLMEMPVVNRWVN
jgi:hypothetical protein